MTAAAAGDALGAFLDAEIKGSVAASVQMAVEDIRRRLGSSVAAVLFYGSCLRTGDLAEKVLDFYVLVDGYRALWGRHPLALANRLIPPNVFYAETRLDDGLVMRSKYAVLSLPHFERLASARTFNASVWARFAQPCRLVYARDQEVERRVAAALAEAVRTMASSVRPLVGANFSAAELWSCAFCQTYRAELRSEAADKGRELYELDRNRYDALTDMLRGEWQATTAGSQAWCRLSWALRRIQGKILSILRLVKGTFTFDGGIDYLAWKISRHSGVKIEITPWQRRHPLLAGLQLFWRLRRRGAFR